MPAADNGLFHSPVVSRRHATLRLLPDSGVSGLNYRTESFTDSEQVVVIQDAGSLHGTLHNGSLIGQADVALLNGDKVSLGNNVYNGDRKSRLHDSSSRSADTLQKR